MVVTLKLEAVADHMADLNVQARRRSEIRRRVPARLLKYTYGPPWRPWVARIVGVDEPGRLQREFLKGQKDFSGAHGMGARGVYYYYHLLPGEIYEVRELLNWTKDRRYFCRVEDGRIVEMSKADVITYFTNS